MHCLEFPSNQRKPKWCFFGLKTGKREYKTNQTEKELEGFLRSAKTETFSKIGHSSSMLFDVECLLLSMCLASLSLFRGIPLKLKDYRNKNPNWRETDQLPVYKHEREVERRKVYRETIPAQWSERDLNPPPPNFTGYWNIFLGANHKLIFRTGIQDPLILWMTHEQFS